MTIGQGEDAEAAHGTPPAYANWEEPRSLGTIMRVNQGGVDPLNGFFVKQANERRANACEGESLIAKVSARKLVGNLPEE